VDGAPGGAAFGRKASQTFRNRTRASRETDSQPALVRHADEPSQGSSKGASQALWRHASRGLPDLRLLMPISGKPEIGCAPFSLQRETENGTGLSAPSGEADVIACLCWHTTHKSQRHSHADCALPVIASASEAIHSFFHELLRLLAMTQLHPSNNKIASPHRDSPLQFLRIIVRRRLRVAHHDTSRS